MKIIKFSNGTLELLFNNLDKNQEIADDIDRRLRAIKRSDGKFALGVRLNVEGKRHYKRLASYPETSISVFRKLAVSYISMVTQDPASLSKVTLNQVFDQYWKLYAEQQLKDRRTPLSRWNKHIRTSKIGMMRVSQIKPILIEQLLQEIQQTGLKPATINKIQMLLSKVFSLATRANVCTKNPCKGLPQRKENNVVKTVFSEEQVATFIGLALNDNAYHPSRALLLSLYTGMRIGEVLSLTIDNTSSSTDYLDLEETKNGNSFRVFLNQPAKKLVEELLSARHNQFLFPSSKQSNKPLSYPRATFNRFITQMINQGEIFDPKGTYSIHMLRRTFTVLLQKKTKNIYAVSQALNHSSVIVTQRYASIYDDDMQHNLNLLNEVYASTHDSNTPTGTFGSNH